ncbi:MAG: cobalamin-dependent protein [Candidatus Omnitrophica bacterium]|nr:cobalamin-dependent protein [Candidatus Omnitrophota bacterium]
MKNFNRKILSVSIIFAFLFEGGFCPIKGDEAYGLQVPSKVKELVDVVQRDDGGIDLAEPVHDGGYPEAAFCQDWAFINLNLLIGKATRDEGEDIPVYALREYLLRNSHLTDLSRFNVDKMYRENGTICLPYISSDESFNKKLILRYYFPENENAGKWNAYSVSVGTGRARVLADEPYSDIYSAAVYLLLRWDEKNGPIQPVMDFADHYESWGERVRYAPDLKSFLDFGEREWDLPISREYVNSVIIPLASEIVRSERGKVMLSEMIQIGESRASRLDAISQAWFIELNRVYNDLEQIGNKDLIEVSTDVLSNIPWARRAAMTLADKYRVLGKYPEALKVLERLRKSLAEKGIREEVPGLVELEEKIEKADHAINVELKDRFNKARYIKKMAVPDGNGGYFIDTLGFQGKYEVECPEDIEIPAGGFLRLLKSLSAVDQKVESGEAELSDELNKLGEKMVFGRIKVVTREEFEAKGLKADASYEHGDAGFVMEIDGDIMNAELNVTPVFLYKRPSVQVEILRAALREGMNGGNVAMRKVRARSGKASAERKDTGLVPNILMLHLEEGTYYGSELLKDTLKDKGYNAERVALKGLDSPENFNEYMEYFDKLENFGGKGPDFIGISAMNEQLPQFPELIRRLREKYPEAYILIGGPAPSMYPEQAAALVNDFDVMVRGEAEEILPGIIEALRPYSRHDFLKGDAADNLRSLPGGIIAKSSGGFLVNNTDVTNMARELTMPPVRVKKNDYYWCTSRGCPHDCRFCSIAMGQRFRSVPAGKMIDWMIQRLSMEFGDKDPDELKKELREAVESGRKMEFPGIRSPIDIGIADDDFLASRKRAEEFCKAVKYYGMGELFVFYCNTRVDRMMKGDQVDTAFIDLLYDAGIRKVNFGTDGFSQAILDENKKGYSFEAAVLPVNAYMRKKGFNVRNNDILMTPDTSYDDALESLVFSEAMPLVKSTLINTAVAAIPGTEFTNRWIVNSPESFDWSSNEADHGVFYRSGHAFVPKVFTEYALIDTNGIPMLDPKTARLHAEMMKEERQGKTLYENFESFVKEGVIAESDLWRLVEKWEKSDAYGAEIKYFAKMLKLARGDGAGDFFACVFDIRVKREGSKIYTFEELYNAFSEGEVPVELVRFNAMVSEAQEAFRRGDYERTVKYGVKGMTEYPYSPIFFHAAVASLVKLNRPSEAIEWIHREQDFLQPKAVSTGFQLVMDGVGFKGEFDFGLFHGRIITLSACKSSEVLSGWAYLFARLYEGLGADRVSSCDSVLYELTSAKKFVDIFETLTILDVKAVLDDKLDAGLSALEEGKTVRFFGIPVRFFREEGRLASNIDDIRPFDDEVVVTDEEIRIPAYHRRYMRNDGESASSGIPAALKDLLGGRSDILISLYDSLDDDGKRIFLNPAVFSVLLGVEPAYFPDKEDPDAMPLYNAIMGLDKVRDNLGLIFLSNGAMVDLARFLARLKDSEDARFMVDAGIIFTDELAVLTDKRTDRANYSLKCETFGRIVYRNYTDREKWMKLERFLRGAGVEDIEFEAAGREIGDKNILESLYGIRRVTHDPDRKKEELRKLDVTLSMGYMLFETLPGFRKNMPLEFLVKYAVTKKYVPQYIADMLDAGGTYAKVAPDRAPGELFPGSGVPRPDNIYGIEWLIKNGSYKWDPSNGLVITGDKAGKDWTLCGEAAVLAAEELGKKDINTRLVIFDVPLFRTDGRPEEFNHVVALTDDKMIVDTTSFNHMFPGGNAYVPLEDHPFRRAILKAIKDRKVYTTAKMREETLDKKIFPFPRVIGRDDMTVMHLPADITPIDADRSMLTTIGLGYSRGEADGLDISFVLTTKYLVHDRSNGYLFSARVARLEVKVPVDELFLIRDKMRAMIAQGFPSGVIMARLKEMSPGLKKSIRRDGVPGMEDLPSIERDTEEKFRSDIPLLFEFMTRIPEIGVSELKGYIEKGGKVPEAGKDPGKGNDATELHEKYVEALPIGVIKLFTVDLVREWLETARRDRGAFEASIDKFIADNESSLYDWNIEALRKLKDDIIGLVSGKGKTEALPVISEEERVADVEEKRSEELDSVITVKDLEKTDSPEKKELIILLDTAWIKTVAGNTAFDDVNPLLTGLRKYYEARGMKLIAESDRETLLSGLKKAQDAAQAKGIKTEVMALIDQNNAIFNLFKQIPGVFLLGISPENVKEGDYIRIVEIMNIALRLKFGFIIEEKDKGVSFREVNGTYILTLLPLSIKLDPVLVYRSQIKILFAA